MYGTRQYDSPYINIFHSFIWLVCTLSSPAKTENRHEQPADVGRKRSRFLAKQSRAKCELRNSTLPSKTPFSRPDAQDEAYTNNEINTTESKNKKHETPTDYHRANWSCRHQYGMHCRRLFHLHVNVTGK